MSFPNLKPSTETISLRLPQGMLNELKVVANERMYPISLCSRYSSRNASPTNARPVQSDHDARAHSQVAMSGTASDAKHAGLRRRPRRFWRAGYLRSYQLILGMSAPKYARIAITLPPDDLAAADRLAAAQDRSRSWIVAEALRQYVARSEPSAALGASRHRQVLRDLQQTAEARIRDAEEREIQAVDRDHGHSLETPVRFATYDEFAEWRRAPPSP